jgi:putative ABC transport system permease protein
LAGVAVERCRAGQVQVMPGYHEAMGVRILAGRAIETGDSENAEPVAVINEALARVLWKGEMAQALGRQIRLGGGPWRRIVGVAADVQQVLVRPVAPEAAIPMAQQPAEAVALAIRTRGDAAVFSGPLRRAAAAVDPALPVGDIAPMESIVADYFPRVMTVGLAIFALAATLLASIGLYGVVAFSTERRRREIGIRVALGAERLGIVRLVVSESLRLALYGVAAGLVAAFAVARVLAGFLYGVGSGDLLVFGSVSLLMLAVAAAAGYLPARRAAAGDPVAALREE